MGRLTVSRTADGLTWTLPLGESVVEYRLDAAQVQSELDAAIGAIQAAIDQKHHSAWRFKPAADEGLFQPRADGSRWWYIRNSVIWFAAVFMGSAATAWLVRAAI
jgi:hypothetical protein